MARISSIFRTLPALSTSKPDLIQHSAMTNKEIANAFKYLADLMELHQENPFKIRSYRNAYLLIRKWPTPLEGLSESELSQLKGIGKAISSKIVELTETGTLKTIQKYETLTPEGVREILKVPGIGPKKVRVLWKELGAESVGELLYACNENRLVELKGFGLKTQEDLKKKLAYYEKSKGSYLYASIEDEALQLLEKFKTANPGLRIELTGAIRRKDPVLPGIELLVAGQPALEAFLEELHFDEENQPAYRAKTPEQETTVMVYTCAPDEFGSKQFLYTATADFLKQFVEAFKDKNFKNLAEEKQVFEMAGLPFIEPELRSDPHFLHLASQNSLPILIETGDIKGVIHSHSTYSDGINSLEEMAQKCIELGYEYLVISDHSKSAFYANGLKEDRLEQQWKEVDELNARLAPFKIFKSIESDILNDGSLDYEDEVLAKFDLVIASVHSNLRMDKEKATQRLLEAIRNPYTTILGHPTGRLLLSREGYPVDHKAIIDACAEHGVIIELNANPYRLDLDWTWIPYALEKGVMISINPDAHSTGGIEHIKYGVYAARKGGLDASSCLSAYSLSAIEKLLQKRG